MSQLNLFDPAAAQPDYGRQNKVETYIATQPRHSGDRLAIIDLLRRIPGGLTRHQMAAILGLPLTTVCGRITELKRAGVVRENGERRPTEAGKSATVVVLVENTEAGQGGQPRMA